MTLPIWDQLQKSLDNPETIEQAIARVVAEHESDPVAHLGIGESLEQHKKEDVIDHPAGSILADKATMTEFTHKTIFESLSAWTTLGTVDNGDIPGMTLYIEDGFVEQSGLFISPQFPRNYLNNDKNIVFQIGARYDLSNSNFNGNFGLFSSYSISPQGFGFVVDDGVLYGHAKRATDENRTLALTFDYANDHVYRAYLDAFEQKVYFHIDGVEVGVVDVPPAGFANSTGPRMWLQDDGGNDGVMTIGELYFTREI